MVLGAGGKLGSELTRQLPEAVGMQRGVLSVTDLAALDEALPKYRPDVVFNCAAYNDVDAAESQQDAAYQVNAQGAFNVAMACARNSVRLIHFSTNFVFDGALDRPYSEQDAPQPLGVYAKSKLEGEKLVSMILPEALIIRTSGLYAQPAPGVRPSFPQRIVERAANGERIRVVNDQSVNPTYVPELAAAAAHLAEGELTGVVHLVAGGCCTWEELARAALAECGVEAPVDAISSAELGAPAPRPANGCMASSRVSALRPWRESLKEWAERWVAAERKGP